MLPGNRVRKQTAPVPGNSASTPTRLAHWISACGLVAFCLFAPAEAIDTSVVFNGFPDRGEFFPGVDTLWLGATMYTQVDNDSVFVQFVYSAAYWAIVLDFMNPLTGVAERVFGFDQEGLGGQCPVDPGTGAVVVRKYVGSFPANTELVFMLRSLIYNDDGVDYCSSTLCGPRYTGLNNPLKSAWYSSRPPVGGSQYAQYNNHPWAIMSEMDSLQMSRIPHP